MKVQPLPLLVGGVHGNWTILAKGLRYRNTVNGSLNERRWKCRCTCGIEAVINQTTLRNHTKEDCRHEGLLGFGKPPDNRSKHPLYNTWYAMMVRCHHPPDHTYENYGGRGISVCEDWHDFWVYSKYMDEQLGPKPAKHSMDRIDNNGNYEPGNIRWATASQQAQNKRTKAEVLRDRALPTED